MVKRRSFAGLTRIVDSVDRGSSRNIVKLDIDPYRDL